MFAICSVSVFLLCAAPKIISPHCGLQTRTSQGAVAPHLSEERVHFQSSCSTEEASLSPLPPPARLLPSLPEHKSLFTAASALAPALLQPSLHSTVGAIFKKCKSDYVNHQLASILWFLITFWYKKFSTGFLTPLPPQSWLACFHVLIMPGALLTLGALHLPGIPFSPFSPCLPPGGLQMAELSLPPPGGLSGVLPLLEA